MEEKRLRAHLLRIYCITVSAVLFAVLFIMALLFYRDEAARSRETFSALLFAVSDQLGAENAISHMRLREFERENRLLLSLRDNGRTLLFNSGDSEEKRGLFLEAEQRAKADGCDIGTLPLTSRRRTSPIYAFSNNGARYLGAVGIFPYGAGYRTVTMVQRASRPQGGKLALLFAGYLASALLLCLVGARLIDRALRPAVESRKRQAQFVAAASHELRSPLAVISANAATIRADTPAAAAAMDTIEAECARMSRLIGDMLLLASTDANSWPVKLTKVELDTLLINVYETQSPLFSARGCVLTLLLPEEPLPHVTADGERLSEMLSILLDNALSHGMTQSCRRAELAAKPCAGGVSITVADHGTGLTDEQKTQVFARFYRGDASRREKQHFGLGLSIAWELARLQNGKLSVEDTEGGGCTFRITLA